MLSLKLGGVVAIQDRAPQSKLAKHQEANVELYQIIKTQQARLERASEQLRQEHNQRVRFEKAVSGFGYLLKGQAKPANAPREVTTKYVHRLLGLSAFGCAVVLGYSLSPKIESTLSRASESISLLSWQAEQALLEAQKAQLAKTLYEVKDCPEGEALCADEPEYDYISRSIALWAYVGVVEVQRDNYVRRELQASAANAPEESRELSAAEQEELKEFAKESSRKEYPFLLPHAWLSDCYIGDRDLRGAYFEAVHLEGADLEGADLEGAHLAEAQLQGASLTRASLKNADLTEANMTGATLDYAHLEKAKLKVAVLSNVQAKGAWLTGADLTRSILTQAELEGADLQRVRLCGANLAEASLHGADLTGSKVDGANLKGVQFNVETSFSGVWLEGAMVGQERLGLKPAELIKSLRHLSEEQQDEVLRALEVDESSPSEEQYSLGLNFPPKIPVE